MNAMHAFFGVAAWLPPFVVGRDAFVFVGTKGQGQASLSIAALAAPSLTDASTRWRGSLFPCSCFSSLFVLTVFTMSPLMGYRCPLVHLLDVTVRFLM